MAIVYEIKKKEDGAWYVVSHEVPSLNNTGVCSGEEIESGPHATRGEAEEKMRELATRYVKNKISNASIDHIDEASNYVDRLPFSEICGTLQNLSKALNDAIKYCNEHKVNEPQTKILSYFMPMRVLDIAKTEDEQYVIVSNTDQNIDGKKFTTYQSAIDVWEPYVRGELWYRLFKICMFIIKILNGYGISKQDLDTILKMVNEAIDYCTICSKYKKIVVKKIYPIIQKTLCQNT